MTAATSEPTRTSEPRMDRTVAVILIATFFILTTVPALYFVGRSCFDSFPMPLVDWSGAVRFQDELIGNCMTFDGQSLVKFRTDLRSGQTRFENCRMFPRMGLLASNDNRLWEVLGDVVAVTDGRVETRYTPQRALVSPISPFFLYQNCPAVVDIDDDGVKYQLYVLQDGEWQAHGEVGIPGAGRTWAKNELTGVDQMQPSLSSSRRSTLGSQYLDVFEVGGEYHLFFSDNDRRLDPSDGRVTAYRKGFDFFDRANEASAMAPENVPADTTGWSLLDLKFGLGASAVDRDQIVLVRHQNPSKPIQFWELASNTTGVEFKMTAELKATNRWENLELINSPNGDGLYFIRYRPIQPKFYLYKDLGLREIPPPWDTDLTRIVRWAEPVLLCLVAIFLIGLLFLVACAEWLGRRRDDQYGFGLTHVRLAPIWRRCLARAIDLSLILALAGFYAIQLGPYQIARDGYELWDATQPGFDRNSFDSDGVKQFFRTVDAHAIFQSLIWAAVVFFILIVTQSRWGVTPGKWVCRVRVWRSTLRPCGFARSLLRELALIADAPLLLTILPAIITMLYTDHRQRLGDLLADTVVVDAGQ